ncbi:multiple epidermal growth factor-like domains protein 11 [Gallus gallus]|uniref:multiple epidermal growth factor-like domains protein 11 n=1 Tax=Gallus gallus TaxID=9031 RepID=UPI000739D020|nr:multiple epidermal growth factor-like domains protein 11 [Gallus gallus]XP_040521215.1 multiple epidermal growth factor-like domains protein 11 [Gallus gallus]|eukprot:XP_015128762.1 multiple epidermal growth factor-like domains protein 11 [Gallus gallus]
MGCRGVPGFVPRCPRARCQVCSVGRYGVPWDPSAMGCHAVPDLCHGVPGFVPWSAMGCQALCHGVPGIVPWGPHARCQVCATGRCGVPWDPSAMGCHGVPGFVPWGARFCAMECRGVSGIVPWGARYCAMGTPCQVPGMCHRTSWSAMGSQCHGVPWGARFCAMGSPCQVPGMCRGASWSAMGSQCHGVPWGARFCAMGCHGVPGFVPWGPLARCQVCAMEHHGVSWDLNAMGSPCYGVPHNARSVPWGAVGQGVPMCYGVPIPGARSVPWNTMECHGISVPWDPSAMGCHTAPDLCHGVPWGATQRQICAMGCHGVPLSARSVPWGAMGCHSAPDLCHGVPWGAMGSLLQVPGLVPWGPCFGCQVYAQGHHGVPVLCHGFPAVGARSVPRDTMGCQICAMGCHGVPSPGARLGAMGSLLWVPGLCHGMPRGARFCSLPPAAAPALPCVQQPHVNPCR